MILLVTSLLLFFAWLCHYFKKSRSAATLAVLAGAVLLGAASGLIARPMAASLQRPYLADPGYGWSQNNVIVLLGAGTEPLPELSAAEPEIFSYGRIQKAAEAYLDCKKFAPRCRVLISGGDPQHHGMSEAEVYGRLLQRHGVSRVDIRLENKSRNTWQNAQYTAALLGPDSAFADATLLLVTSGYHMRRSLMYFAWFGLHPRPLRADLIAPKPGWSMGAYNLLITDVVLHEYVGMWRFELYDRFGWNAPKADVEDSAT